MSLLFYIDEKNKLLLQPDAVKLCPELAMVSEKELVFIILAYDNYSIFKQFPERERERRAMWYVFGDAMPELLKKTSVVAAAHKYKSLQFSPKIEYISRFQRKIDNLFELLTVEDSPSQIEKITKSIESLRSTIMKLEHEVNEDVQNVGVLKGGAVRSLLEEFQTNMKYYKSILMTKPIKNNEVL